MIKMSLNSRVSTSDHMHRRLFAFIQSPVIREIPELPHDVNDLLMRNSRTSRLNSILAAAYVTSTMNIADDESVKCSRVEPVLCKHIWRPSTTAAFFHQVCVSFSRAYLTNSCAVCCNFRFCKKLRQNLLNAPRVSGLLCSLLMYFLQLGDRRKHNGSSAGMSGMEVKPDRDGGDENEICGGGNGSN